MSDTEPRLIMVINSSQELLVLFQELIDEFGEGEYRCEIRPLTDDHHIPVIRDLKPALVIVDQPFGDDAMRGWDLVQNIRLARDLKGIPLIFMTTNVQLMQDLDAQLAALNVRTLLKPFDPDNLLRQIGAALEQSAREAKAKRDTADE